MTGTAPDDATETRDDRIGLIHGAQVDLSMLAGMLAKGECAEVPERALGYLLLFRVYLQSSAPSLARH